MFFSRLFRKTNKNGPRTGEEMAARPSSMDFPRQMRAPLPGRAPTCVSAAGSGVILIHLQHGESGGPVLPRTPAELTAAAKQQAKAFRFCL